jgi:hypothetical protein
MPLGVLQAKIERWAAVKHPVASAAK